MFNGGGTFLLFSFCSLLFDERAKTVSFLTSLLMDSGSCVGGSFFLLLMKCIEVSARTFFRRVDKPRPLDFLFCHFVENGCGDGFIDCCCYILLKWERNLLSCHI